MASVVESKVELFITDSERSKRFYRVLGFEVAHAKDDGYTTLQCGSTVVALSPVQSRLPIAVKARFRRPPWGTEIVLYTDELEASRGAMAAAGYLPGSIARRPWGDRDYRITDPDGYYLRISDGRAVPGRA